MSEYKLDAAPKKPSYLDREAFITSMIASYGFCNWQTTEVWEQMHTQLEDRAEHLTILKAELAEAVELLKVSTALLECNAQPIDKPSIEANNAFLARHGDHS